jgi:hypothetical protein
VKPDVDQTLRALAQTLLVEIAPQVRLKYEQNMAEVSAALLLAAAEEWDRAAERRVEENRALRRLFQDAAPKVADPSLRERLEESGRGCEGSLQIRALDRENDRLRALLIELHTYVEQHRDSESAQIEREIWEELRTSTRRRALSFWPL